MLSVLVADDDRLMVRTVCDLLRHRGFEVRGVHSGEEALAAASQRPWSAVLMDIRMSGLNGVDAAEAIRRERPSIPVILMTAYTAAEELARAEQQGIDTVLTKPFTIHALFEALTRVLETAAEVLVVDDDPEFLATMCDVLRRHGVRAVAARDLDEALRLLRVSTPSVVLLDLRLDHHQPRESVAAIKKVAAPAVLILYSGFPEVLEAATAAVPRDWFHTLLAKPFSPEHLLALLDAHLRR